jgi:hypothetical protein
MITEEKQIPQELDTLLVEYKAAVEQWVGSIREEESLVTRDHSMKEWEAWDQAAFKEEEARGRAKAARQAYADALREKLYNF